jgi:hypothetical protein
MEQVDEQVAPYRWDNDPPTPYIAPQAFADGRHAFDRYPE